MGCRIKDCLFNAEICERLAAYKDTGLEPEEIKVHEAAKYNAGYYHGDEDRCRWIEKELGPIDHLRDLLQAEQAGRLVVLPCQSGEHVFALLDNQTHVWECEVEYAVLDGWRKVFVIRPLGRSKDLYYAPFGAFGQSVFLTREAAEKALEAMKNE